MHDQVIPTFAWILNNIYPLERPTAKLSTIGKMKSHVMVWNQMMCSLPANQVDRTAILTFRKRCVDVGRSPSTINSYVRTILGLAKIQGIEFESKRLSLPERDDPLPTPEIDELSRVWHVVAATTWPLENQNNRHRIWCTIGRVNWWRGLLMLAFVTGLRRSDLFGLKPSEIREGRIPTVNRKTGKLQYIPIPDRLQVWLNVLLRMKAKTLLGAHHRQSQIDREMGRLGKLAGIENFGCQSIRRASSNAYEAAHEGTGKLILNHGKSVTERNYVAVEKKLRMAQPKLIYPTAFTGPSKERQLSLFL